MNFQDSQSKRGVLILCTSKCALVGSGLQKGRFSGKCGPPHKSRPRSERAECRCDEVECRAFPFAASLKVEPHNSNWVQRDGTAGDRGVKKVRRSILANHSEEYRRTESQFRKRVEDEERGIRSLNCAAVKLKSTREVRDFVSLLCEDKAALMHPWNAEYCVVVGREGVTRNLMYVRLRPPHFRAFLEPMARLASALGLRYDLSFRPKLS